MCWLLWAISLQDTNIAKPSPDCLLVKAREMFWIEGHDQISDTAKSKSPFSFCSSDDYSRKPIREQI